MQLVPLHFCTSCCLETCRAEMQTRWSKKSIERRRRRTTTRAEAIKPWWIFPCESINCRRPTILNQTKCDALCGFRFVQFNNTYYTLHFTYSTLWTVCESDRRHVFHSFVPIDLFLSFLFMCVCVRCELCRFSFYVRKHVAISYDSYTGRLFTFFATFAFSVYLNF